MQISTYINDLLYRYECVIIPGFGAFLTQYRSAKIDETTHTFYPPGKIVTFNKQLQANDGLLANYVASVDNCTYEVALQKIRTFTGKVQTRLSNKEVVLFQNIGEFLLNEEHALQFTPSEKENFSIASFGLSSFVSEHVLRGEPTEKVEKVAEKAPLLFTPEKRERYPYLKYAAVAIIALSVAGIGAMKLYEGQVQKFNFAEKQKADALLDTKIQEATFVIENPLPTLNLTLPKLTGKYHIVAGAFRMEENATKKLNQLRAKGYAAKSIGVNQYGLHVVVYSSYQDRLEARKSLQEIKLSENNDAWLLVRDLNN